jgi:hypothetical protein
MCVIRFDCPQFFALNFGGVQGEFIENNRVFVVGCFQAQTVHFVN